MNREISIALRVQGALDTAYLPDGRVLEGDVHKLLTAYALGL